MIAAMASLTTSSAAMIQWRRMGAREIDFSAGTWPLATAPVIP
jgi:hypothetical protein